MHPCDSAHRCHMGWQALGYSSSIGYNTFLYGSETDSRNLLMW